MHFNVSHLLKGPSGSGGRFDVNDTLILTDGTDRRPVVGTVGMLRTDKGIWVSAALKTLVECTCSRCLVQFEQPIPLRIEEEFLPLVDLATGARVAQSKDGEDSTFIDQNHVLDISEAVRQYSALNTPMKPVCRENCAGICPTCGVSLNETQCGCDSLPIDIRWQELMEIMPVDQNDL